MKNKMILPLLLVAVVLVSGCTDALLATLKIGVVDSVDEEIKVIAEVPAFVREGQTFPWNIEVSASRAIENIEISVFDKSPFLELVEGEKESWSVDELMANETKTFQSKYKASETEFEQDLEVQFLAKYQANFSASEEVTILDDFEYEDRFSKGTLSDMSFESKSDVTPLKIEISFDKDSPFMNDTRVLMYVDYSYSGQGIIDKLTDIEIILPEIIEYMECPDFDLGDDGILRLNKEKEFLQGKSVQSSCEFQTQGDSPIATGTISLKASYVYQVTGSAQIELRKR